MTPSLDLPALYQRLEHACLQKNFTQHLLCDTAVGPILGWTRHASTARRHCYLSAGMHGDEPAGPLALAEFLEGNIPPHLDFTILPILNPTGLTLGTRENAAGIDLNRDYLQRSSPEIAAHAAWLEQQRIPDLSLSLHEDWETIGFYFYEIALLTSHQPDPQRIHTAVRAHLPIEPSPIIDDHLVTAPGWIYHAPEADLPDLWPEAIFLAKLGCPLSYTFETPSQAATLQARIQAHLSAIHVSLE